MGISSNWKVGLSALALLTAIGCEDDVPVGTPGGTTGTSATTTGTSAAATGATTGTTSGMIDAGATGATGGTTATTATGGATATTGTPACTDTTPGAGNDCAGVVQCYGGTVDPVKEGEPCDLATDSCCVTEFSAEGAGAPKCERGTTTCSNAAAARTVCDGPEDCTGGQECCFKLLPGPTIDLACAPAGSCVVSGDVAVAAVLCHDDAHCGGKLCEETLTFNWWSSCE